MQKAHCLNCGTAIYPKQNFCSHCGQKADTKRYTFYEIFHQLVITILNAERGLLRLLKGLVIRPGVTASEFVEGKRKRYYNPFTFLALVISFVLLTNNWFKQYDGVSLDPKIVNSITDQKVKSEYIARVTRFNEVNEWTYKYMNTFVLFCCPYFALFLWLFFKKRNRNMAEIAMAYLLFSPVAILLSTFLFSPLVTHYKNTTTGSVLSMGDLFIQNVYVSWGMSVFLGFKNRFVGLLKVLGVICLFGLIGFLLIMVAIVFYVYNGQMENLRYAF